MSGVEICPDCRKVVPLSEGHICIRRLNAKLGNWPIEEPAPFTPCEQTIRLCIEALPYPGSNLPYRAALEALLPQPDRAKELVDDHRTWRVNEMASGRQVPREKADCFARWLINEKGMKL